MKGIGLVLHLIQHDSSNFEYVCAKVLLSLLFGFDFENMFV